MMPHCVINIKGVFSVDLNHAIYKSLQRIRKDIFALQDEITLKIITALQVKLTAGNRASALVKGTDNLETYLKLLQGVKSLRSKSQDKNLIARKIAGRKLLHWTPSIPKAIRFWHIPT